tara:strand:- start:302 stop:445 length:144 start_codon:yes stop_codon:yes gene_type:complete
MFLDVELSGFDLNMEQDVKIRGTVSRTIRSNLLLIAESEGSFFVFSK